MNLNGTYLSTPAANISSNGTIDKLDIKTAGKGSGVSPQMLMVYVEMVELNSQYHKWFLSPFDGSPFGLLSIFNWEMTGHQ